MACRAGLTADRVAFLILWAQRPSWAGRTQDPLTAREHEVAELVAQALPSREVARPWCSQSGPWKVTSAASSPSPGSNQGTKSPAGGCGRSVTAELPPPNVPL